MLYFLHIFLEVTLQPTIDTSQKISWYYPIPLIFKTEIFEYLDFWLGCLAIQ